MVKRLLLFLLVGGLFMSCNKTETKAEKDTVEYFKAHLKADMDFAAIKAKFGEPHEDKGSGIHIYVYDLKDGTHIWIGYTTYIMYARQVDSNGQIIATLI